MPEEVEFILNYEKTKLLLDTAKLLREYRFARTVSIKTRFGKSYEPVSLSFENGFANLGPIFRGVDLEHTIQKFLEYVGESLEKQEKLINESFDKFEANRKKILDIEENEDMGE